MASVSKDRLTKGETKITVRAFCPGDKPNIRGGEVLGAKCSLASDELRATVVTPQVVIAPNFKQRANFPNRGVPGSLDVRCTAGQAKGKALLRALEKQLAVATDRGIAGLIVTAAVSTALATSTPWTYPAAANVVASE